LLVKVPMFVPLVILLFATVGFAVVAQQTPLTVTADPPSLVMLPPLIAVVEDISEAAVVVSMGAEVSVTKVT
jgi:hypothetical protein